MAFYDRADELEALSILKEGQGGKMIVLIGRRRVGKTTLIKHFLGSTKGAYLYLDSSKKKEGILEEFSDLLRTPLGLPDYFRPKNWEELFSSIYSTSEPCIVVIDEFQRFADIDKSAIYSLQKVHDLDHDRTKANLLVSGSSVGMLKRIFTEEKAPLYKRAINIIDVRPFDIVTCFDIYRRIGVANVEEMIRLHTCFGDLPMMFYLFDQYQVRGFKDALKKLLLGPFAPLRNEVSDTMIESFGKEHPTYFGILSAISQGKRGTVEIANRVGINATSLYPYISDLESIMGVVTSELPVTIDRDSNSKKGRYILKDNFYKFWFRFFYGNRSLVEMGSWDALMSIINDNVDEYVSREVEGLIADLVRSDRLRIGFTPNRVGRWWNRRGDEIDLLALDDRNKIALFGEVKWSNRLTDQKVLDALIRRSELVVEIPGYHKRYMIFSRSGFSKDLRQEHEKIDVKLFDLKDIQGILDRE